MERYIHSKTDNYLIIRPFNVYGPGQNPNNGFIAKAIANQNKLLSIILSILHINSNTTKAVSHSNIPLRINLIFFIVYFVLYIL